MEQKGKYVRLRSHSEKLSEAYHQYAAARLPSLFISCVDISLYCNFWYHTLLKSLVSHEIVFCPIIHS